MLYLLLDPFIVIMQPIRQGGVMGLIVIINVFLGIWKYHLTLKARHLLCRKSTNYSGKRKEMKRKTEEEKDIKS